MAADRISEQKTINRLAFEHYLRTGLRLTSGEWLARGERKFNPYHDELGRFTSPPGVTVSSGAYGNRGVAGPGAGREPEAVRNSAVVKRVLPPGQKPSGGAVADAGSTSTPTKPEPAASGFRSELVRNSVSEGGDADTYFELNKRQAGLNRLRQAAGPNPAAVVRADLDEIQARLNANRLLLDQRSKIADRQVTEILRAGLAPIDTAAGAINILSGDGELRDVIAVAGVVPIASTVGKFGKLATTGRIAAEVGESSTREIIQLGGAFRRVKGLPGYEAHHMPGNKVSPLSRGSGPSIAMLKADHRAILTSANSTRAKAFRAAQKEHIARGDFAAAMQMDIDHVRSLFGNKYDDAIEQAQKYSREKGIIK